MKAYLVMRLLQKNTDFDNLMTSAQIADLLDSYGVSAQKNPVRETSTKYNLDIFLQKNIRHIIPKNRKMMCLTFIYLQFHACQLRSQLLASLFDSNRNSNWGGHTNHGIVACADQTHHSDAKCHTSLGNNPRMRIYKTFSLH